VEGSASGLFRVHFFCDTDFRQALETAGEIPLPPYIHRNGTTDAQRDRENYQTVYARKEGAVAAPTAGLHFTRDLMAQLEQKGIEFEKITLHVGHGTFAPVRVADIRDHQIHSEFFSISPDTAQCINRAKKEGRRVIAVGTTSVRTLEFCSKDTGQLTPGSGMCNLFIYPGYKFRMVDAMITNFHLPESTLLMLVSAYAGRDTMLHAYKKAVENNYRFFSYGDAMLLE
jgi:S-adenosylmethionine:tRNA ribosyltransferase-isomerase